MGLPELAASFGPTRESLHRVAAHVLARRRAALTGRFGLRATPGGFGTPAAGPEHEVLRVSGSLLVRERTGEASTSVVVDLAEASLDDAAALADVDLTEPFEVGHDTPELGARTAPLRVDAGAARVLGAWFALGAEAIDGVGQRSRPGAGPSVAQLWPEHFDLACDVAVAGGSRANLGASPGDDAHPEPYLYVGPWGPDRPGEAAYWNAPFGALLGYSEVRAAARPLDAALGFFRRGIELLDRASGGRPLPASRP